MTENERKMASLVASVPADADDEAQPDDWSERVMGIAHKCGWGVSDKSRFGRIVR